MPEPGLGRAVLELAIEDKAFTRDLAEAEQHAEALGRRFREVGRSLDEVARGMGRAGARVLDPVAEGMSRAGQAAQQAAQAASAASPAWTALAGSLGGVTRIAAGFGVAFGVRGVLGFLASSHQEAREAAREQRSLATAVEATGVSFGLLRGSLAASFEALEDVTGMAEGEFSGALGRMIQISGDVQGSLAALETVADLAAARFRGDLRQAAEVVGRVLAGQTEGLRRLGIRLREGASAAEALAAIQRQVAGQGAAAADETDRLARAWEHFKEGIGQSLRILTPLLTAFTAALRLAGDIMKRVERSPAAIVRLRGLEALPLAPTAEDFRRIEEAAQEADRETRRALTASLILRPAVPPAIAEAFAALEAATEQAEAEFKIFRDGQAALQANLEATRTALKALAGELPPLDGRVLDLKDQFDALDTTLGTLTRPRELRFDRFATERSFETADVVARAEQGAAAVLAVQVAQIDEQLANEEAAQATIVALEEETARLRAQARADLNAVYVSLADQAIADEEAAQREIVRLHDAATREIERIEEEQLREIERRAQAVTTILGQGLEEAALRGRPLREVLQGIAQDLAVLILRLTVIKSLESALGGLFAGFGGGGGPTAPAGVTPSGFALNIPGAQHGGRLGPLEPAIVGEAGPELWIPRTAGTIVPNDRLGGTVVNIDARGAQRGVSQEIMAAIRLGMAQAELGAVNRVVDEQRRGGHFRSAFRG